MSLWLHAQLLLDEIIYVIHIEWFSQICQTKVST